MKEESKWATDDLVQLERLSWELLTRGAQHPKEDMHWPTFGTVDERGRARLRTVVLRQAQRTSGALIVYTDSRAQKVTHLQANPWASLHFYDGERRVQLRAQAHVTLHIEDDLAREHWARLSAHGRFDYCREPAPATQTSASQTGLPDAWSAHPPEVDQTQWAFPNFCVMVCALESLDVLYLGASGHRRAHIDLASDVRTWLIP